MLGLIDNMNFVLCKSRTYGAGTSEEDEEELALVPDGWPVLPSGQSSEDVWGEWHYSSRTWQDVVGWESPGDSLCGHPRTWTDVVYASVGAHKVLLEESQVENAGKAKEIASKDGRNYAELLAKQNLPGILF
jgi:hypothetical protein